MTRGFLPNTDGGLLAWSTNFLEHLLPDPQSLGISQELADAYQVLHDRYAVSYGMTANRGVRSMVLVSKKNACRAALKADARRLVSIIRGQANVSDSQKVGLGITVRGENFKKTHPPEIAPTLSTSLVSGRVVRVKISDSSNPTRGRPLGVIGTMIFTHVGPIEPSSLSDWTLSCMTNRMAVNIPFESDVPPGSQVWFCAHFFNIKCQRGPVSSPITTYIAGGGVAHSSGLGLKQAA